MSKEHEIESKTDARMTDSPVKTIGISRVPYFSSSYYKEHEEILAEFHIVEGKITHVSKFEKSDLGCKSYSRLYFSINDYVPDPKSDSAHAVFVGDKMYGLIKDLSIDGKDTVLSDFGVTKLENLIGKRAYLVYSPNRRMVPGWAPENCEVVMRLKGYRHSSDDFILKKMWNDSKEE